MDLSQIYQFAQVHAPKAHWYLFSAILLAGINIPISIDLVVLLSALTAATLIPEHTPQLYLAVLFGCYFSAWLSYWKGRLLGGYLLRYRFFSKLLPPPRLERAKSFYEKYGLLTLMIGRFIPFGVRNCIFMTTGISKQNFFSFILRDALACFVWVSTAFALFYTLSQKSLLLYSYLKTFNILIFSLFSVAGIAFIWYKIKKRKSFVSPTKE